MPPNGARARGRGQRGTGALRGRAAAPPPAPRPGRSPGGYFEGRRVRGTPGAPASSPASASSIRGPLYSLPLREGAGRPAEGARRAGCPHGDAVVAAAPPPPDPGTSPLPAPACGSRSSGAPKMSTEECIGRAAAMCWNVIVSGASRVFACSYSAVSLYRDRGPRKESLNWAQ